MRNVTPPARQPAPSCAKRAALHLAPALAIATLLATTPAVSSAITPAEAIAALTQSLDAPLRREGQPAPGLLAQMQRAGVPGLSVAVVHQGRLHWAQGFGQASPGVPVTAATRFQAASISKPVAGLAALALADETGTGWDADLRPQLGGFVLPGDDGLPRYTLRRLLTHSAGLDVPGFPGYAVGTPVPTLQQLLQGVPPANTGPVVPAQPPGAFRYSGGGTSLVQLWMQQRAKQDDFAQLMQQRLLGPLGMSDTHFQQPPRDGAPAARYAWGHADSQPVPGGHRIHPEQAAAGMWTTPSDLARLMLAVQAARRGEPGPIAPALARAMTTPGPVPDMGIAFFFSGQPGRPFHFSHGGRNIGFSSLMLASLDGSEGVALMANAESPAGELIESVLRTLARVYGWPSYLQAPLLAASQALPKEAPTWAGDYPGLNPQDPSPIRIRLAQDALWFLRGPGDWVRLWRLADGSGYTTHGPHRYQFTADEMTLDGSTLKRQPARERTTWPTIYLRGSFNDWSTATPLQPAGPGRWQAEVQLPAGRHSFKLADADWREVDLGAGDEQPLPTATWHPLQGRGGNLRLAVEAAGRWQVELELDDSPKPARVRLRVVPGRAGQ